jgi:hypothetical protein
MLKQKYITDLVVNDEGGYWEGRDRRLLAEKRIFLGQCLRRVEKTISGIKIGENDPKDAESIADRIEEELRKADEDGRLH